MKESVPIFFGTILAQTVSFILKTIFFLRYYVHDFSDTETIDDFVSHQKVRPLSHHNSLRQPTGSLNISLNQSRSGFQNHSALSDIGTSQKYRPASRARSAASARKPQGELFLSLPRGNNAGRKVIYEVVDYSRTSGETGVSRRTRQADLRDKKRAKSARRSVNGPRDSAHDFSNDEVFHVYSYA